MVYQAILRGIKLLILLIGTILFSSDLAYGVNKQEASIFLEVSKVTVMPIVISGKIDNQRIKQFIEKKLSSFGTVMPDDPQNFGKINSVLKIMIGPIAEEDNHKQAKYFPVISISMTLLTKASLKSDKQEPILGLVWEKQGYIGTNSPDLEVLLEKQIDTYFSDLFSKYRDVSIKPVFFILKNL
ncbi:MAG: insulinase family protein [Chlamydiae bacterium]|nr:insulinase family protein [Chlamydiota bacterium]